MPRRLRLYLPNAIFHVTARAHQHWFDEPMRDFICRAIGTALRRTDAKVRAGVVMSNHLHLVVQQGDLPLSALMQPLLRRIALAVQRKVQHTGHVFAARFWERACTGQSALTVLLDYIHNNPVRAELCQSPCEWRWSSFGAYHGMANELISFVEPFDGIMAPDSARRLDYIDEPQWRRRPRLDMRDLFQVSLRRMTCGEIDLEMLLDMRGRKASKLRNELIAVGVEAGYRGVQIARLLRVSNSMVSKVAVTNSLPRSRIA